MKRNSRYYMERNNVAQERLKSKVKMYAKNINYLRRTVKRLNNRINDKKALVKALKEKALVIVKNRNMSTPVRILLFNDMKCSLVSPVLSRDIYIQLMMK